MRDQGRQDGQPSAGAGRGQFARRLRRGLSARAACPARPRPAPAAAARTGSPARSARRSRADRPPCSRFRCARRSDRCRSGPSRSARSAGWMSLCEAVGRVEQQLGRHLEEAERRGRPIPSAPCASRRHDPWRSGSRVRPAPPGFRARAARRRDRRSGVNSNISALPSARLASMKSRNWRKYAGSRQRRGADIAEQADVAALELQAARHLHAAEQQQVVDLRHQADAFGVFDEIGGGDDVALLACAGATSAS